MVAAAQIRRILFEEEENRPEVLLFQAAGGGAGLMEMHVREYGGIEGTNEAFLLWFREGGVYGEGGEGVLDCKSGCSGAEMPITF